MTLIAGTFVIKAWIYLPCRHRWHWRHPRFHAVPLTGHHTAGNGLGGTVTWA